MPLFNFTIPDTSPLITYKGTWSDSNHNDPLWESYANGTFHATPQQGDQATLRFNGSAVYVFGATRSNHGPYTVRVDGHISQNDGQSSTDEFQTCIFSRRDLSTDHEHELVLTNEGSDDRSWVDLDYVLVTTGDGDVTSPFLTMEGDRASSIDFSNGWHTVTGGEGSSSAINQTDIVGAHATITFFGDSIAVYGNTGKDYGDYSASLDNLPARNFSALTPETREGELLFWATNLPATQHTLNLTHLSPSNTFGLSSFSASSWTLPSSQKTGPSTAALAALVGGCASLLLLFLLGIGWWLWRRRRHFAARSGSVDRIHRVRHEGEKADLLAGLDNTSHDSHSSYRTSGTYERAGTPAPPYNPPPGYEYDEPEYVYHSVSAEYPDARPSGEAARMSMQAEANRRSVVPEGKRQSVAPERKRQSRQAQGRGAIMEEVDVGTLMSADDVLSVRASVARSNDEKKGLPGRGRLSVVGGPAP